MREIQRELVVSSLSDYASNWENQLNQLVWKKFEELKASGFFKIKVLKVFTIDISGKVAELLVKWFGPEELKPLS